MTTIVSPLLCDTTPAPTPVTEPGRRVSLRDLRADTHPHALVLRRILDAKTSQGPRPVQFSSSI